MNSRGILLPGFAGTMVLTSLMAASQGCGPTRMNLPFLLGTMFTASRDRTRLVGFGVHMLNGWLFASIYAATFRRLQRATWWLGVAIGLVHAMFVLLAALPALPSLHPRMASEEQGPSPTRQLQPPGFMARNYGRRTPVSVVLAHLTYGAILGLLYRPESASGASSRGVSVEFKVAREPRGGLSLASEGSSTGLGDRSHRKNRRPIQ